MREDSLASELIEHLYVTLGNTPLSQRGHWVMNNEWLNEVRRATGPYTGYWTGFRWMEPETLLGLPIDIRDSGGVPHLEPID